MANELNFATNYALHTLHLPPQDTFFIRHALLNYENPTDLAGYITWVAYRIYNAVKSIFEKSDWQVCVKTIKEHYMSSFQHARLSLDVWRVTEDRAEERAKKTMEKLLAWQNDGRPDLLSMVGNEIEQLFFEDIFEELRIA